MRIQEIRRVRLSISALCAVFFAQGLCCQGAFFFDDFNRPDSNVVGNGWSNTVGNYDGVNLIITNNVLAAPSIYGGRSGIYRPFPFDGPLTVTATITEKNGFGGLLRAYDSEFVILNSGGLTNDGYRLVVARSDQNAGNSQVILYDGGSLLGRIFSPFQYGPQLDVSATFALDGSVTGVVSEGLDTFNFSYGPHAILSSGPNFSFAQEFADSRSSTLTQPTMDNLTLSTVPEPSAIWLVAGTGLVGFTLRHKSRFPKRAM